jgi:hypothetical protein
MCASLPLAPTTANCAVELTLLSIPAVFVTKRAICGRKAGGVPAAALYICALACKCGGLGPRSATGIALTGLLARLDSAREVAAAALAERSVFEHS